MMWDSWLKRRRWESRMDAEFQFHLDSQISQYLAQGLSREEAERRARSDFGALELAKDECRDERPAQWLHRFWRDLAYAGRSLRRSPGFAAAAILTLALGIGANSLIFSVVNAVFLRPLPYQDYDRLVWATEIFPNFQFSMVPDPDFLAWKQHSTTLERIEAMTRAAQGANLTGDGKPAERIQVARTTPGFFAMIGIAPRLGPGFDPNAPPPASPSAIISDTLWHSYFAGDRAVVGKSIFLDGKPHTILGVMPPGFLYPDAPDTVVWTPTAITPANANPAHYVRVVGKLKPGISLEQARLDLEQLARSTDDQFPKPFDFHAGGHVRVVGLQTQLGSESATTTTVLMGAVGFLLLIACANVANLFLARAVARRKEIAVRTAIGAAQRDIVRMLIAESLLLGGLGGALGMVILFWGRGAVAFLLPKVLSEGIPIDWRVLAFTTCCSLAAGLLFGLAPSWVASRVDVNSGLKETAVRSVGRLPGFLAAGQVALSLILLAGAGLLIRTFVILATLHPGFDAHNVLTADVALPPTKLYGPDRQIEFFRRVLTGLQTLPSVRYAAVTNSPPMTTFNEIGMGLHTDDGASTAETISITSASPEYFRALGVPLLAGRYFDTRDGREDAPTAIINQSLAHALFPGRDPIGRHAILNKDSFTIVGVVADMRHRALDEKVWPEIFRPFEQAPSPWMTIVVRGVSDPSALANPIRGIVRATDPSQPLFDVDLLEHRVSETLALRRERALVLGAFAALALLIAVVGIYGVLSYAVARRTHEIALRIALGAGRGEVLRLIVGAGLRMAAAGMTIGLIGALALTRVLRTFLFGTGTTDAATFSLVCAILAVAAGCASYLPARRAAAVDPMTALRRE